MPPPLSPYTCTSRVSGGDQRPHSARRSTFQLALASCHRAVFLAHVDPIFSQLRCSLASRRISTAFSSWAPHRFPFVVELERVYGSPDGFTDVIAKDTDKSLAKRQRRRQALVLLSLPVFQAHFSAPSICVCRDYPRLRRSPTFPFSRCLYEQKFFDELRDISPYRSDRIARGLECISSPPDEHELCAHTANF